MLLFAINFIKFDLINNQITNKMKNIYLALVSILLFASCGQEPASKIENKIKVGSLGFHVSFVVPNDATERMDQFITTHEQFMRETHHFIW
jgi:uncharacterized lipoprotein YajG